MNLSTDIEFQGNIGDLVLFHSVRDDPSLVGFVINHSNGKVWLSNREVRNEEGGLRITAPVNIIRKVIDKVKSKSPSEESIYCTELGGWDNYDILKKYLWNGDIQYINLVKGSVYKNPGNPDELEESIGDLVLFHRYNRRITSLPRPKAVGYLIKHEENKIWLLNREPKDLNNTDGDIIELKDCSIYWPKFEVLKKHSKKQKEKLVRFQEPDERLKDIYGVDLLDFNYDLIELGKYYHLYSIYYSRNEITTLYHTYFTFQGKEEVMVKCVNRNKIYEAPLRTTPIVDERISKVYPKDCRNLIPVELRQIHFMYKEFQDVALRAKEFLELGTKGEC